MILQFLDWRGGRCQDTFQLCYFKGFANGFCVGPREAVSHSLCHGGASIHVLRLIFVLLGIYTALSVGAILVSWEASPERPDWMDRARAWSR